MDLEKQRKLTDEDIEKLQGIIDGPVLRVSAKTGAGIEKILPQIKALAPKVEQTEPPPPPPKIEPMQVEVKHGKNRSSMWCCCGKAEPEAEPLVGQKPRGGCVIL